MSEQKIKPAELPDALAKRYKLNVPQPKHFIPSLGRVVDVTTLTAADAKIIADKHPALLTAVGKTENESTETKSTTPAKQAKS